MNERDVFIAALQLESRAQRQEYLDRACGGDETLRRNVVALLEAHDRAGSFLQAPPVVAVAGAQRSETAASPVNAAEAMTLDGATEPRPPSVASLAPPQQPDELGRLGHYRVLRLLGQGGMGMVFLAEDPRLGRSVALKVMLPELASRPEARERFLREARAQAQIEHDHIVPIYQVDQSNGVPFLAMPLLKGLALDDYLKDGKVLSLPQVVRIGRDTARGLAAAHERGLIHRDIKPANLWLDSTAGGRVKILDFGLARPQQSGSHLTAIGTVVGTPAYMPPEQIGGKAEPRSDLYSLGVVLYRLLAGRLPFPDPDVLTVLMAVATEPVPPLRDLAPHAPAVLADLVMRLLAKKPEDRPGSAREVAEALQGIQRELAGTPAAAPPAVRPQAPSAPPPPQPEPASAPTIPELAPAPASHARRRRLALAVGLGLAGLAVGLLVAGLAGAFRGATDGGTAPPGPIGTVPPKVVPVPPFALSGHKHPQVQALAFTGDSKTLVSADYGGQILFWDMERREKSFEIITQPMGLWCLAVDSQRRWLAVGHMNKEIRLFRFGQRQAAAVLKGHTDRVAHLAFLKDGRTLLSAGYDGSVRRWDVEKQPQQGKPLRERGPRLDGLAVWEDGKGGLRLALAGLDRRGFVSVDDQKLENPTHYPDSVALSPDGTRLACTATENNGAALWELPAKKHVGLLPEAPTPEGLAFTPDGKYVVVMGLDHTRIYETAARKQAARVDHTEKGGALAVSSDGAWLAVGTLKGGIRVWHLPTLLAPPG